MAKKICFKDSTKIDLHDKSDYQVINSKINAKIHFKIKNTIFASYIKGVQTKKQINIENILKQFSQIKPNDYIIHKNYGIGQFLKIKTIDIDKKQCELLEILYSHNDRLLLPIENINLISKYRSDNYKIDLDSLRSKTWTLKKKKAKAKIMQIADKLITNAAIRQKITLEKFLKDNRYDEFCENFNI